MLVQTFVHWPIFSTAANGGMFFSSHVTGQSHNPARGRRLALKYSMYTLAKTYLIRKAPFSAHAFLKLIFRFPFKKIKIEKHWLFY
jgi:hypothetical protein